MRSTKFFKRVMRPSLKRKGSGFSVSLPDGKEIHSSHLKRFANFDNFSQNLMMNINVLCKVNRAASFELLVVYVDDVKCQSVWLLSSMTKRLND